MSLVLAIESATKNCSVALIQDGHIITLKEEYNESFSHAEKLTLFIEEVLKEAKVSPKNIQAIIVDKGPGSYTGLRIGVSTAKGMTYGLKIPLLSIGSLETLYWQAVNSHPDYDYYIPMIDARRMEVYTQVFDKNGNTIEEVNAKIIDEESYLNYQDKKVLFFGDGAEKCQEVLSLNNAKFITTLHPSAQGMNTVVERKIKEKEFEDNAYFEPYYLKDFIAGKPKKML